MNNEESVSYTHLIPDDGGETIFIAERNSAHAMNNDKVKIALFAKRKNRNPEGEVIEILERANDTFVLSLIHICIKRTKQQQVLNID